ncbi:MAG: adenosine kinase [Nakamurella sp.]
MTQIDVLVLGGAGVDTIVRVPELPLPYADSYMVPAITTRAGQTGDGVALALAALGHRVHHLDVLGDDPEGDLVRALHTETGVPLTTVTQHSGTKRAVNLVDPGGRRLSLYDISRGDQDAKFPDDLLVDLVRRSRHVHVTITHPCAATLPLLTASDVTVSTDLHNWDGSQDYHRQFAAAADVVFVSADVLQDVPATLREIAAMGRPQVVVATNGAAGAWQLIDEQILPIPPVAPDRAVVDSNGAGDAFAAGYLHGWLAGEQPDTCGRLGAAAGAHCCTVPATEVAPITAAELLEMVRP